jgi:hypothetical protein
MKTSRIRVQVEPGMFSSERYVSFAAGDRKYALFVDQADVRDDTIEVGVVAVNGDEALVDLPRETLTSGNRISIPRVCLLTILEGVGRPAPISGP